MVGFSNLNLPSASNIACTWADVSFNPLRLFGYQRSRTDDLQQDTCYPLASGAELLIPCAASKDNVPTKNPSFLRSRPVIYAFTSLYTSRPPTPLGKVGKAEEI